MCNISITNMHYCKLLVTKLYKKKLYFNKTSSVFGKRLAISRLQTVGDKPVEEVCADLRDRYSQVRFDDRRLGPLFPNGVRRDLLKS